MRKGGHAGQSGRPSGLGDSLSVAVNRTFKIVFPFAMGGRGGDCYAMGEQRVMACVASVYDDAGAPEFAVSW